MLLQQSLAWRNSGSPTEKRLLEKKKKKIIYEYNWFKKVELREKLEVYNAKV